MKLRQLEMALQKVRGFERPDPRYEQYQTPAPLAARLLFDAALRGDIERRTVLDLGCGTGILAIGACLLGAAEVRGVEQDPAALRVARENASRLGVEIELIESVIGAGLQGPLPGPVDTVVMNPPFGAQKEHADRPFIDTALILGRTVHGIFNSGSAAFVMSYVEGRAQVVSMTSGTLVIPRTFSFHTKDRLEIPVEIMVLERTLPL
jgi:putative methylase